MTEPMTKYTFTIKGGKWWTLTQAKYNSFAGSYQSLNLDRELLAMIEWCECNPYRRKTASGMHRFINGWLKRSSKGHKKTKLYPIKGRICDKSSCGMPAVYKNNWGHTCSEHMPERVKELFC